MELSLSACKYVRMRLIAYRNVEIVDFITDGCDIHYKTYLCVCVCVCVSLCVCNREQIKRMRLWISVTSFLQVTVA